MQFFKKQQIDHHKHISDLFLHNYPLKSRFAESFRTLRTNIQFSSMDKNLNTLMVTSTGQEEGKTSTVANLSYTMAKAGKTVLMIDGDLRKPSLSKLVEDHTGPGFSDLLSGLFGKDVVEGKLEEYSMSDLYRLISLQNRTGWLSITDGSETVELLFLNGELKDINWLTRPDEKKLATLLVRDDVLKKEDIKRALARQKTTGKKLGFTLLSMGLLNEEEIKGILGNQIKEALRTALQFKTGNFHFRQIDRTDYNHATFDPVDFELLYNQLIVGEEEFIYLRKGIEVSIRNTVENGLFLLPSGKLPANPSELLSSRRIPFLLSILKKLYDIIIIDTPPILPASDALNLIPCSDGVIFVTKSGFMNREMVKKAVDNLRHSNANIIGVVLNQVDITREGYYNYYYKYYSKYYGE